MAGIPEISTKRMAISRANAQMVIVVAVASFVTVFCLIASKTVLSQNIYQAKVTSGKETAKRQLNANLTAFNSLQSTYKTFDNQDPNFLNGSLNGSGDNDGDNATLILHALPPTYDFPALASSLQKVLADRNFQITGLSGTDDQLNQQANLVSPTPQPVPMPFSFAVADTNYQGIGTLLNSLQASIRPISIDTLSLSGDSGNLSVSVTAHTYYQPSRNFALTKKVQK